MKKYFLLTIFTVASLFNAIAYACEHQGSCGKACAIGPYFISPQDGATVDQSFTIEMGIKGLTVHKAGQLIEGTGHHHLIIDGKAIGEEQTVPKDATHLHFGKGQTQTTITLKPGKHTLTLQFADGHHQSYGKIMSRNIEVHVK
ncbi:MAG: DUF4399 domain-containing protein [Ghiorsea sp.]